MKTLLKLSLALLLLLFAAPLLILLFLDPNDFKDEIREQVRLSTGRELALDGDLRLSLHPWTGVEVREASLSQPPGFGTRPFARIERAQVHLGLLALLRGRVELEEVRGEGLTLNLVRARDGRINWQQWANAGVGGLAEPIPPPRSRAPVDPIPAPQSHGESGPVSSPSALALAVGPRPPVTPATEPGQSAPPPPASRLRPLADNRQAPDSRDAADNPGIGRVAFEDVRVTWENQQTGLGLTLEGLSLATGPLSWGEPVALRLAGDVAGIGAGVGADLVLEASLTLSRDGRDLTLAPFELRLEELTWPGGPAATGSLTGALGADLAAQRYRFERLALGLDVSGGPIRGRPLRLEAGAELELTADSLELAGLRLVSGELRLEGDATGTALPLAPVFSGRLALAELDLRAWLEGHGLPVPPTSSRDTLTRVALTSDWSVAGNRLALNGLDLRLDQTRILGAVALLATHPVGYRFDLEADRLDLDPYLPHQLRRYAAAAGGWSLPGAAEAGRGADAFAALPLRPGTARSSAPGASGRLPVWRFVRASQAAPPPAPPAGQGVPGLDLAGRVRLADLRAYGLTFGDVDAEITSADGLVRLEERVGRFYGGRLQGHGELRPGLDGPRLALVQRGEALRLGPLLHDLVGDDLVTGQGGFEADLSAGVGDPGDLRRSLSGELSILIADGSVKGFNLEHFIRRAEARLKGRPAPPPEPERTAFTELRASARIDGGVLTNEDLFATSSYIHARGSGTVDLLNERLDYRLEPWFVDPPEGRGIKEIEGIPIPVKITGSVRDPDWSVDLASVLRDVVKRKLGVGQDGEGTSKLQELEERTGIKGLEKGLRRLFNF